ncbi:Gtr1/RagA G protein conserved region-domain-containing protein [Dichomitus squalens]|uniref:GTP-binding protein n=1 Tax=Dichomitus squalens TaxID=114155 RepID=A0A4V2K979_9APHY|nr:Gtr1/RagA G protein conserved region-domain-containing protein [Dichomitus squalens]TBU62868.1 Gtr1/RagA G protein conserved region-domain-containing protein [Dichomitus squalens]
MSRASAQRQQPSSSRPTGANGAKPADNVIRTKILLLGMRRSGKTSIQEVLFGNCVPRETLYLETTTRITKHYFDTIIPLEVWDCPGDITLEALDTPLTQFSTMIFVIDIQDLYQQPIKKLVDFVIAAYQENQELPNMNLEVFVHKADVLTEEYKIENFRHIQARVLSDLSYDGAEYETIPINFQLTSIFDHSLHDAFSRVLHKLIDSLPYLEDLLNVFCANSQATKAFLFDTKSRLYVATDASPVDPPTHNLCSDYLQTLNNFGPLYKSISASPFRMRTVPPEPIDPPSPDSAPTSPQSQSQPQSGLAAPPTDVSYPHSRLASPLASPHTPARSAQHATSTTRPGADGADGGGKPVFWPCAAASLAPTAAGAGTTLTYHLITAQLALLAIIPTGVCAARRGLVEYNVVFFREGVQEICDVEAEARKVTA